LPCLVAALSSQAASHSPDASRMLRQAVRIHTNFAEQPR
jgi:hypothetical protein